MKRVAALAALTAAALSLVAWLAFCALVLWPAFIRWAA